jgi:hypothetical protein
MAVWPLYKIVIIIILIHAFAEQEGKARLRQLQRLAQRPQAVAAADSSMRAVTDDCNTQLCS